MPVLTAGSSKDLMASTTFRTAAFGARNGTSRRHGQAEGPSPVLAGLTEMSLPAQIEWLCPPWRWSDKLGQVGVRLSGERQRRRGYPCRTAVILPATHKASELVAAMLSGPPQKSVPKLVGKKLG